MPKRAHVKKKVQPPERAIRERALPGNTVGPREYDLHRAGADLPSSTRGSVGWVGGRGSGKLAQVTAIRKRPPASAAGGGGPRSSALDVGVAGVLGLAEGRRGGTKGEAESRKDLEKESIGKRHRLGAV